jgi:hypothetical protein
MCVRRSAETDSLAIRKGQGKRDKRVTDNIKEGERGYSGGL